jgi:hypothetical protein
MSEPVRLGETEQFVEYAEELARRQGQKEVCPDCSNDPDDTSLHKVDCRRLFPVDHELEYLQYGPPWRPWPDTDACPEEER